MGSGEGRVYADLSPTAKVRDVFLINPRLKKNSPKQSSKRINEVKASPNILNSN